MKTAYPIVLTSTEEGYTAYIPDFNITTKGEQQSDAIYAAKNAICMWAFSEENAENPYRSRSRPTESLLNPDKS